MSVCYTPSSKADSGVLVVGDTRYLITDMTFQVNIALLANTFGVPRQLELS